MYIHNERLRELENMERAYSVALGNKQLHPVMINYFKEKLLPITEEIDVMKRERHEANLKVLLSHPDINYWDCNDAYYYFEDRQDQENSYRLLTSPILLKLELDQYIDFEKINRKLAEEGGK